MHVEYGNKALLLLKQRYTFCLAAVSRSEWSHGREDERCRDRVAVSADDGDRQSPPPARPPALSHPWPAALTCSRATARPSSAAREQGTAVSRINILLCYVIFEQLDNVVYLYCLTV